MTCIVGVEQDGFVYMAGDSIACSGYDSNTTACKKVFRVGDYVIGYTTSFRMGQILQYEVEFPCVSANCPDLTGFMVKEVVPLIREALKKGGYTTISDNVESGGQFMLGLMGQLFVFDSDFQVNRFVRGYNAIGCGAMYAMGALSILPDGLPARSRLCAAMVAADRLCCGVGGPFFAVTTERSTTCFDLFTPSPAPDHDDYWDAPCPEGRYATTSWPLNGALLERLRRHWRERFSGGAGLT